MCLPEHRRKGRIMDKIKKMFGSKEEGLSQYVSALISLVCILVFFMAMVYELNANSVVNNVQRINRKYLLSMEKEGYLTAEKKTALIAELTAAGATNINLDGTSLSPVGYGNRVILKIECDVTVYGIVDMKKEGRIRHVIIEKDGTALY